jgi:hypothetical protein
MEENVIGSNCGQYISGFLKEMKQPDESEEAKAPSRTTR